MNYGPAKTDSAVGVGFRVRRRVLPTAGVRARSDRDSRERRECVRQTRRARSGGFTSAPTFVIRAFEDPPFELRVRAFTEPEGRRRVSVRGDLPRGGVGAVSRPVSGTERARGVPDHDRGVRGRARRVPLARASTRTAVAEDAAAPPRARLAARVAGEKQALAETMGYFARRAAAGPDGVLPGAAPAGLGCWIGTGTARTTHSKIPWREVGRTEPRSGRSRGVARRAR